MGRQMPDIPALIHCHNCGYWIGPTTAEDGQIKRCNKCEINLRVTRYPDLRRHGPRSTIGRNAIPVQITGRGSFGNWLYNLPANVNPNKHDGVVSRERVNGKWIYRCVADRRKLKEIRLARPGGVMKGNR